MAETSENKYALDGVDVNAGDSFSEFAGMVCKKTYGNSPMVEVKDFADGHFRGPRGFTVKTTESTSYDLAPDGIGTKVINIDAALAHRRAAANLIAMTHGDITRWGGKGLVFVNILDVSKLGGEGTYSNKLFREMMYGLGEIAAEEGIVCLKGETAELGPCVGSENPDAPTKFNWGGVMFGIYDEDNMITGKNVKPGQIVMALKENGFRSNGISSLRTALRMKFGTTWWSNPDAMEAVTEASTPSVLYDKFLTTINGWDPDKLDRRIPVSFIAHLSGGGIKSKFAEDIILRQGLSAMLDNLYEPVPIMAQCRKWRDMSDDEAYATWHGGQGVLAVIDAEYEGKFIDVAAEFGKRAQKCGDILETPSGEKPSVRVISKFSGQEITPFIL